MKVLIVAGGSRVLSEQLVEAAVGLRDRGAMVDLVSWHLVDKELYSAFANVVVLGPGGSTPQAVPRPVAANTAGVTTTEITPTPPALSAERVKRAIAWRLRKYRSRALRTYHKYASPGWSRLQRSRRHLFRIHKRLDWHPQTAWRRFTANPDAGRLSWICDIVVAADGDAVLTVWHIARRRPEIVAINGLHGLASADLTAGHTPRSIRTCHSGHLGG
jgi:hypothetical protein